MKFHDDTLCVRRNILAKDTSEQMCFFCFFSRLNAFPSRLLQLSPGNLCAKALGTPQVATAIRGGIIAAKLNLIPVRRGFWGNRSLADLREEVIRSIRKVILKKNNLRIGLFDT